jgi:apolipoprotein N-acyltransferase
MGEDASAGETGEAAVSSTEQDDRPAEPAAPASPAVAASWRPRVILSTRKALGLATLSTLLYALALPSFDLWPLAFVAQAPLLVALRGQSVRDATLYGWLGGFPGTMLGFYWLTPMLKTFSGFPLPACVLFAAALSLYQAGRFGLCAWLYARARARGWPGPIAFAAAFATSELVFPLLFPWYYACTVHGVPLLTQTADLGGPIVVGLVLLGSNFALAELLARALLGTSVHRPTVVGGLALTVAGVAYGAVRIGQVEAAMAAAPPVKVGMVQPNLDLHDRRGSIKLHLEATRKLREEGAELVVWSEGALARTIDEARLDVSLEKPITSALGVPTVVGAILRRATKEKDAKGRRSTYFNSALMADAQGKIGSRYDKQYRLMFGEYLPFGDTFPILYKWSPNSSNFGSGTSFAPLVHGEHRLSAMICYEDILPSFVQKLVKAGDPDMLVNLTNDAWFGDTSEPWIHLALSKFRSIEHRRYLVRVTNSGVSAVVDPVGRVVLHGGTFKEETLLGEARWMRPRTPYQIWGDAPWWALGVLSVGFAFVRRRRSLTAR